MERAMTNTESRIWLRVMEVVSWPLAFTISSLILAQAVTRLAREAIPVRLLNGVNIESVQVPVSVRAQQPLPVSGTVHLDNSEPLQVEASRVRLQGAVPVALPEPVAVTAREAIAVRASAPVSVEAQTPISVTAPDPISVSAAGPVSATVDVQSVQSPLRLDPKSPVLVTGGLDIEAIRDPIRANIRGLLFPF
jgi:hypothetical protein